MRFVSLIAIYFMTACASNLPQVNENSPIELSTVGSEEKSSSTVKGKENSAHAANDLIFDVPREMQKSYVELVANGLIELPGFTSEDYRKCMVRYRAGGADVHYVQRDGTGQIKLNSHGAFKSFLRASTKKSLGELEQQRATPVDGITSPTKPTFVKASGLPESYEGCRKMLLGGINAVTSDIEKLESQILRSDND